MRDKLEMGWNSFNIPLIHALFIPNNRQLTFVNKLTNCFVFTVLTIFATQDQLPLLKILSLSFTN